MAGCATVYMYMHTRMHTTSVMVRNSSLYSIQNSGLHFTCMYKKVNKIVIHFYALHLLSVAVIILEQSFECRSTYITEGNNATACATIVYTYGDLPLATNISVLFTTSNGSALSTYVEA